MRWFDTETNLFKRLQALACSAALLCAPVYLAAPILAQTLPNITGQHKTNPNARMLLAADELVYDRDAKTVTAKGNIQIEYDGNHIVAERVVYNQVTGRVIAEGEIEIVEPDGNKIYADKIDLTEDLGDGFINALRVEAANNTRFAADNALRQNSEKTIFNRGVYTACEPCYNKPDKEVTWQLKARRIIWNSATKTMRFENSRFEVFGLPIAYFPVFEMPDPTVKRKSGFLQPNFTHEGDLGFGVRNAYFWNLAPNYDFTWAVTGYSKQGVLNEGEWRHRTENGQYDIRFAHIYQLKPGEFDSDTIDHRNRNRYSLSTKGQYSINSIWTYGWDILAQSDRNFSRTYSIDGYDQDVHRSQIYLTGLHNRNYFDMRFMHFEVQDSMLKHAEGERHSRQPWVLPHIQYSFTPDESVFGGELNYNSDLQVLVRDRSDYAFKDWQNNSLSRARLAGISGTSARWTNEVEWKRSFYSNSGLIITPIAALRGDVLGVHTNGSYGDYTPRDNAFRGMATAGLEMRYPLLITSTSSSHIVEPIAQIFVRNNERYAGQLPNEDAQGFIFDATTLFQRDKFTGYDRVEGGTRANLGVRYSGNFDNGWSLYGLAGQSYQLGGQNPFKNADFVSVGADSGLETARSDYVAMLGLSNENQFALATRGRFDEKTGSVRRGEVEVTQSWGDLWASSQYAYIQKQPDYGYAKDRQEISVQGGFKFAENWTFKAETSYDIVSETWVRAGASVGYLDECFGVTLRYLQTRNPWEDAAKNTIGFMLSFRTIGDFGRQ